MNSSPACDYSTPITQRYVEEGLEDIAKVIVDHREYTERTKNGDKNGDKCPSTGKWEMIHKGAFIPVPVASFGTEFHVKGEKILKRRHSMGSITKKMAVEIVAKKEKVEAKVEKPRLSRSRSNSIQQCEENLESMEDSSFIDPDPLL